MKFYYGQNHTVIQTITNKIGGSVSRHAICKFDENGELETNDPKLIFILQNKLTGCTWDENSEETVIVKAEEVQEILSDEDVRQLAKDKGVKSWHVKAIKTLKKELEDMGV